MNRTRKAIESRYIGVMDIYRYEKVKKGNRVIGNDEVKINDEPIKCYLSHTNNQPTIQGEGGVVKEFTKIFTNPELEVKENSKIVITQHGKTTKYKNSSKPIVYTNHQEIIVEIFDGWA